MRRNMNPRWPQHFEATPEGNADPTKWEMTLLTPDLLALTW
jgi:hypothetical protein